MIECLETRYGKIPYNEIEIRGIPDAPKVKFNNYLPYLVDSSIDIKGAKVIINFIDGKIIKMRFLDLKKLNLFNIKSIKVFSSPHTITFPKFLTPKLAYLTGYLYGDGGFKDILRSYLVSGRYEYKIIVADEFRLQIEKMIIPLFQDLFNIQPKLRTERADKGIKMYYINPTSKLIYRFFSHVMDFPEGPKKHLKIPLVIKNAPTYLRSWFIRGVMDSDGDVRAAENLKAKTKNSPRVKLKLADKEFVVAFQSLLREVFSLYFTGPYTDSFGGWYIQGAKGVVLKANKLNLFWHPIKMWRLKKLSEKLKNGPGEI